ncbi:MAG: hypothetical protein R3C17_20485 [Planctomycetaceae bacterium]
MSYEVYCITPYVNKPSPILIPVEFAGLMESGELSCYASSAGLYGHQSIESAENATTATAKSRP